MKNAAMICRHRNQRLQPTPMPSVAAKPRTNDGGMMFNDFVTRLLLQYGGLYVGQRTMMTDVAAYFRLPGAITEHMLSYRSRSNLYEGFIFVREPIVRRPPASDQNGSSTTPSRPMDAPPGVEVYYYKSREIKCFEGRNFSTGSLQLSLNQQVSTYACAVMVDGTPASDPFNVVDMKSDFGRFARKALFNIRDDWETKFYLRAINGSVVPPLCYF